MHMMLLQLYKKSSHHSSLPSTTNSQETAQQIRVKRRKDLFPKRAKPRITSAISQRQTRDEIALAAAAAAAAEERRRNPSS
jgi:hypothetical protein